MKKTFKHAALAAVLVCAVCTACLSGCGAGSAPAVSASGTSKDAGGASSVASSGAASAATPETAPADGRYAAYADALDSLLNRDVWPDGESTGWSDAFGAKEDNAFAVCDVDGDGREELLMQFSTAPMAGMQLRVYDFGTDGALVPALTAFPGVVFYTNGIATEDWSHSHGLSDGALWPYTLLRYDAESDTYQLSTAVDAWSRSVAQTNSEGLAYPAALDTDNYGTVYLLTDDGVTRTLNKTDYDAWFAAQCAGADTVNVPYTALTAENIAALRAE